MTRTAHKQGFTLVELIVVIVLISLLAAVVLPRLFMRSGREAKAEVDALAALIGTAARRTTLTTQRVALDYHESAMRLMVLRARNPDSFALSNLEWTADLLTPPVALEHVQLTSAMRDGSRLDTRRFRIELGHELRPEILLTLDSSAGKSWTIWLSPEIDGAVVMDRDQSADHIQSRVVDLDRAGRGLSAW
jgi:prepilin-type N-terminal cleavage/methylation domain-containing protein